MAQFDDQLNSLLSNPDSMAQIMNLAQSLSGGNASPSSAQPPTPSAPPPSQNTGGEGLGSLLGDTKTIAKLLPLVQALGGSGDSNSKQLLYALRPYLRQERQAKVDRAVQLARMICIGKQMLSEWGNDGV
ncbi:hypothetical protein RFF05_15290 [Bengtsoniella intestinalis]|uniref:hypothetical protein n=1 Tax=Bengtsoniella intestinalis TaxID=3073143 RepID=UPI00391F052E